MLVGDTPKKSPKAASTALHEPADLQEYNTSSQKRRRLSFGQTPVTPAKAEGRPGPSQNVDQRPGSPTLSLTDEENLNTTFELHPTTEKKVMKQELKLMKRELKLTRRANKAAEREKAETDKEIRQLRRQIAELTGSNLENCSEDELHQLGKMLTHGQVTPCSCGFEGDR